MIEKIILEYLNRKIDIPVYMEEDDKMPEEYILIEKTGSGGNGYIKKATITFQSFSTSLYGAAIVNEKLKKVLENIIELNVITECELNSDYNYTDTKRKKYRYQAVYDIAHY